MDVDIYLKRINCTGLKEVSLENLIVLQKNHLKSIPFENLDIHMGKHIDFSLQKAYDKVIKDSRGGYCLELNPLFGWLLKSLGYEFYYVPAYVFAVAAGRFMKFKTHIILIVKLDNKEYYADVTSPRKEPIELAIEKPSIQSFGTYKLKTDNLDPEFLILEGSSNKNYLSGNPQWSPLIKFKLIAQDLSNFEQANEIAQSKDYSTLIAKNICTLHTDNKLLVLVGWKYSEITYNEDNEERIDEIIKNTEQIRKILCFKFGIVVDDSLQPKDEPIPQSALKAKS